MTTNKTLSPLVAVAVVYSERYVLAPVYLYLAWVEFHALSSIIQRDWPYLQIILREPLITRVTLLEEAARHFVSLLLNFSTGAFLLLGRRASSAPQNLRDVVVPLVTVLFVLVYNFIHYLPASLQKSLFPAHWIAPFIAIGLMLGVIGPAFSIWSLLHLRRSFGIFVVVRNVVLAGPYRWVRHPMYLGYLFLLAGVVLINGSIAYIVLVSVQVLLLLWRARLEENLLSQCSPEYRDHCRLSGFIFPKFRLGASLKNPTG